MIDYSAATTGTNTRVISASTTKGGTVFIAPKTGNIRYIGTAYTALSGSPALDLRIETVSAKLPTGTLFGTNTNAAYSPVATNSFVWTQLTADAAVTAGDVFAAVVGYTSGTSATLALRGSTSIKSIGIAPYVVSMGSGSWATTGEVPFVSVKYDDGTIVEGTLPCNQVTNSNLTSSTNPNERATVFTAPASCSLAGVFLAVNFGSSSTSSFSIRLYQGTNTSPIATIVGNGTGVVDSTNGYVFLKFGTPPSLSANQVYRLGVTATGAGSVGVFRALFASTADRDATFGALSSDTRNGSSWVGETTTTTEFIFPVLTSITAGGGGLIDGGLIS